ncbi:MAG: methylaspartate mutase, partial [Candidatus Eisenbacteria bacterium]|nr:methylaspartate mutase [Candidatus Eisenbacteria bacterium]
APRRQQSFLMMLDAFLPEGITELAVDSIFMMPQLGVLSKQYPEVATEVFEKDCMIRLGTAVAPWGAGKAGQPMMKATITLPGGKTETRSLSYGELALIPLGVGEVAEAVIEPTKGFDLGLGKGKPVTRTLKGGEVGIVLDARGRRPFEIPKDRSRRVELLKRWNEALNMYPREVAEPAMV